ncbi:MAG: D-alanine--D-alanine ligase [Coriobacteriia bacterium]|nr:D-alanine--D-alanine ligase [Coriobacteriia bacterium]
MAVTAPRAKAGEPLPRTRVAVLMGGRSAEREVSLKTGAQVSSALRERGHDVAEVDARRITFIRELQDLAPEVVFVCLHGRYGEDGTVQGLLELLDMPYVGSGVLASAMAMDKVTSKAIYEHAGIPTPDWVALRRGDPLDHAAVVDVLGERLVVKPANEGSAIGVTIVQQASELPGALEEAFSHCRLALVERYVAGAEVTVGVLGNDEPFALPTLQIVPEHDFYDYEAKYVPGMSRHLIPADIEEHAQRDCERLALEAHAALRCRGVSRTDLIVAEDGRAYALETNTIPGMTETSLLPEAARAVGISFPDLCELLVRLALEPRG